MLAFARALRCSLQTSQFAAPDRRWPVQAAAGYVMRPVAAQR
nr:MAG TPA: hypothetical protein [Caudoviricetes sp.]